MFASNSQRYGTRVRYYSRSEPDQDSSEPPPLIVPAEPVAEHNSAMAYPAPSETAML
jgi:hypothetical protein